MPTAEQRIKLDEKHRFLNWQTRERHCDYWVRWLRSKNVPHKVVRGTNGEWTIYKHMWVPDPDRPYVGNYCCGADG